MTPTPHRVVLRADPAVDAVLPGAGGSRFAGPDEVAAVVAFLLSAAAAQVSGVELAVDGGYLL